MRAAKKFFGFWRGKKIFRFCGWQKLTDVRRLKKECGVLGSVYIFFRFFRGARRKAKIPTMGQGRKFFIFFNVDMRLGRVFFPLKKMNAASCGVGECTYFGLADSKNFS